MICGVPVIAVNQHPDHDTIATFRRRFLKDIEALFVRVLELAREMGLLKLGTVALQVLLPEIGFDLASPGLNPARSTPCCSILRRIVRTHPTSLRCRQDLPSRGAATCSSWANTA